MNLTLSNLFHTHPSPMFSFVEVAVATVVILFVASFILEFFRKRCENASIKKAVRSLPSVFRWLSIAALVMTWSRLEGIPYFSMRFLWIVLFAFFVYATFRAWRNYVKIESKREKFADKVDFEDTRKKYLPKKKKK